MSTSRSSGDGPIVVGVDGSSHGEQAVLWAADAANRQKRALTLVHVEPHVTSMELSYLSQAGIPPAQVEAGSEEAGRKVIARAHAIATDRWPDLPVETVIGYTDPRTQLLEMSSTASMVVVGTRGHGPVVGLLLGSVSGALLRHADCPVSIVRAIPDDSYGGVLLATDGSEDSGPPVETAFREASERQVGLTIAHCLREPLARRGRWAPLADSDADGQKARLRIAEAIAGMAEEYPDVDVEVTIASGTYDAFILDQSSLHDLLVIGRPPLSVVQRLTLNGLTTSIAEHAHSPVLVVP